MDKYTKIAPQRIDPKIWGPNDQTCDGEFDDNMAKQFAAFKRRCERIRTIADYEYNDKQLQIYAIRDAIAEVLGPPPYPYSPPHRPPYLKDERDALRRIGRLVIKALRNGEDPHP